jgi:hypothetical protein
LLPKSDFKWTSEGSPYSQEGFWNCPLPQILHLFPSLETIQCQAFSEIALKASFWPFYLLAKESSHSIFS